ncbi:MAG: PAS domain-containing protein [Gemmataceae bacterium]|jgi:PAS domain S-box-containing protein|nr:PAS domain-containing protein [Gemmataceae bacterium]
MTANHPLYEPEVQLAKQRELTRLITEFQARCLLEPDVRMAFTSFLDGILLLTESEYGFIGEILQDADQKPYLKMYTITDISWNEQTSKLYQENEAKGLEFRNLNNLFGVGILTQKPVLSNDPANDPRRGGLPIGHPPLKSFLGIPIFFDNQLIAYVGIANRPQGYQVEDMEFIHPICVTIGQVIYSRRAIQAKQAAEQAQRESEQYYRNLANSTSAFIWTLDREQRLTFCNQSRRNFLGEILEKEAARGLLAGVHPEDEAKFQQLIDRHISKKEPFSIEYRLRNHEGEYRWILDECTPQFGVKGEFIGYIAHGVDITAQKNIENSLRQAEKRLYETQELAKLGHWEYEIATNRVEWSPTLCRLYGIDYQNPPSLKQFLEEFVHPDDLDYVRGIQQKLMQNPSDIVYFDFRINRKNGSMIWVQNKVIASTNSQGQLTHLIGITQEITERKLAEQAIKESQRLLEIAGDVALVGGWDLDLVKNKLSWSKQTYRIHEVPEDYEPTVESAIQFYAPEAQSIIRNAVEKAMIDGSPWRLELPFITAKGKRIWVMASGQAEIQNGKVVRLYGAFQDITARKLAEKEQETLRNQLVHSQRLESVGRLAGGVAHDFNNMLSVIIGNMDLALELVSPNQELYSHLLETKKSALRSADLVRQLLAFARKQPTAPSVIDLNEVIQGMLNLLMRLIGENIQLKWHPMPNLPKIKIDPIQVDQLLANLCVNAKDAIAGHGIITISTSLGDSQNNYPKYVELQVSDTGSGIPPEMIEHIFEPFFTTKDVGQGTGLGLAMVYGIVQQNRGYISVNSQVGQGTTFHIFFPVCEDCSSINPIVSPTQKPRSSARSKTILLVEDEQSVLKLTQTILQKAGYKVLTASTPYEALQIAADRSFSIDILLTDVVMPEMDGEELSRKIQIHQPHIRKIYMSGYPAEILAKNNINSQDITFISKPFMPHQLIELIESILK